ncbi:hypothetical protein [Chitinophaga caseinilytica]|uniref:Uncharacterized protein n=1 Tax=Chitinophaga caseinilytica TaxID=2267521 RepID=A0ABZ2YXZ1_9BACT
MIKFNFKHLSTACLLLAGVAAGCSGGAGLPKSRNKLPEPDFPGGQKQECSFASGNPAFASGFAEGMVDLSIDGTGASWLTVPLPDASYDSLAFSLAETYRPIAGPMINQWAGSNDNGIVLDLRAGDQATQRADFSVKTPVRSISVVLLWDRSSAFRASAYLRTLQTVPGIKAVSGAACFQ